MKNENNKINDPNNCQKIEAKNTCQGQQLIKKQPFLSVLTCHKKFLDKKASWFFLLGSIERSYFFNKNQPKNTQKNKSTIYWMFRLNQPAK